MPRIEIERFERAEDADDTSAERFDRAAFAERALELVRPPRMRVAIREGARRLNVASGRSWGGLPGARWAIVNVPANASRRAIATAVLDLHDGTSRAWTLDVLMAACSLREPSEGEPVTGPYRGNA